MTDNDFDQLIKDNLKNYSSIPSHGLGKKIGRQMFLKNIWIFHKNKTLFLLILITTSSTLLYLNNKKHVTYQNYKITKIERFIQEQKNYIKNKSNRNARAKIIPSKESTNNENTNISRQNDIMLALSNKKSKSSHVKKELSNQLKEKINPINSKQVNELNNSSESTSLLKKNRKYNKNIIRRSKKDALYLTSQTNKNILPFYEIENLNDEYVKEKNGLISFDGFITLYNQTKIKNNIENQFSKNWWNFYKESPYVNSKLEAGIRVNYEWRNLVATTGINYERIIEYMPDYNYYNVDNDVLLSFFNVSEISGVQINSTDSSQYVFYAQKDNDLIRSIEESNYNSYHYLSIPIKVGYEFEAQKFSIILQGGLAYNFLTKAKGNYLRRYQNTESLDIYYNKGIEIALLSKNNSMLKPSYFSFLGSIAGNAKVNPSFDVFGEFTCSVSQNTITNEPYFNLKKVTNFGTNFGIKYYLKPRNSRKKIEQQIF